MVTGVAWGGGGNSSEGSIRRGHADDDTMVLWSNGQRFVGVDVGEERCGGGEHGDPRVKTRSEGDGLLGRARVVLVCGRKDDWRLPPSSV